MKISFWTYLQYAWGNRKSIASHQGYVAYISKWATGPSADYWVRNNARASRYPEGDHGWRHDFTRLPVHDALLREYALDAVAGQGSTFTRALALMDWFCAHTSYNGMEIRACYRFQGKKEDSLRILRYAYDGGFRRAINCTHKALAFADCLMAAGITALPLAMQSYTWRPGEEAVTPTPNHFVVHVWLPESRRWVMLDPSLNSYVADETSGALHLAEIHERHRRGESLRVARYDFNGTQDHREHYLRGFILGSLLEILTFDAKCSLLPDNVPRKDKSIQAITVAELLAEPTFL